MESTLSRKELIQKIKGNENVSNADTSLIDDMHDLFNSHFCKGAINFNQPLNDWDVSHVKTMESMFNGATSFNQPLNDWDVSRVTDMSWMFGNATSFNQPLNDWDISNVANMGSMFYNATSFNQPLNDWDVSHVTNMQGMFCSAKKYTHSFKSWKLDTYCKTYLFLSKCILWHLLNTEEDMPMKNNERVHKQEYKIWKVL